MRRWLQWSEWRYQLKYRLGGYFMRGYRGWASIDTWSFDTYLAGVIAGGLRHLASHSHGHPCDFPGGAAGWEQWMREKADWFEWYEADDCHDAKEYMAKMDKFFNEVLPDFAKHFGGLWD